MRRFAHCPPWLTRRACVWHRHERSRTRSGDANALAATITIHGSARGRRLARGRFSQRPYPSYHRCDRRCRWHRGFTNTAHDVAVFQTLHHDVRALIQPHAFMRMIVALLGHTVGIGDLTVHRVTDTENNPGTAPGRARKRTARWRASYIYLFIRTAFH